MLRAFPAGKAFFLKTFCCWQEKRVAIKNRYRGKLGPKGGSFVAEDRIDDIASTKVQEHVHTHVLADGTTIQHTHGHLHSHTQTKAVLNRMSRLIGHLEAIKRMVEEGRDCSEVLVQLSAVRSAINGVSKIILKDHLEHCVVDAVKENDKDAIAQLNKAIDQFMK